MEKHETCEMNHYVTISGSMQQIAMQIAVSICKED